MAAQNKTMNVYLSIHQSPLPKNKHSIYVLYTTLNKKYFSNEDKFTSGKYLSKSKQCDVEKKYQKSMH